MHVTKVEKVLFLCVHNACRSQMAEGFVNFLFHDILKAYSAGSQPFHIDKTAVEVMAEVGIDISSHRSKSVLKFKDEEFDYVITVCGGEKGETCPVFPGKAKQELYWPFPDPAVTEDKRQYRRVRDKIREKIKNWGEKLT
jgi:arsenate reductase (thioredoxin)